jgi:hypothetical protein
VFQALMACDPCTSYCKCHGGQNVTFRVFQLRFFRVIIIGLGLGSEIHLVWPGLAFIEGALAVPHFITGLEV